MADFALWGTACERALGWPGGSFLSAYDTNRIDANAISLDSSPLTAPLRQLLDNEGDWTGTAAELLNKLAGIVGEQGTRGRDWPKNGRSLSGQLKRLTPNFAAVGIGVKFLRDAKARSVTLTKDKVGDFASFASFASSSEKKPKNQGFSHDANHDAKTGDDANHDAKTGHDASMTQTSGSRVAAQTLKDNGFASSNDANDANDAKSRPFSYLAPDCSPEQAVTPFDS
jgi:hypothetical protein